MSKPNDKPLGWKREPWVWVLIAIPLSAVIMGIVMITLALQSWSGLVVDDYYKQGKHINRVLARDKLAWELGLGAELNLEPGGEIEIRFEADGALISAQALELELVHATRPGLDRKLDLKRFDTRGYRGRLDLPGQGRWNLYLQTADWRLTGSLRQPGPGRASLRPNYIEG